MGMHEPWKASAPEVYHLKTTDGSVPRGLDPNEMHSRCLSYVTCVFPPECAKTAHVLGSPLNDKFYICIHSEATSHLTPLLL